MERRTGRQRLHLNVTPRVLHNLWVKVDTVLLIAVTAAVSRLLLCERILSELRLIRVVTSRLSSSAKVATSAVPRAVGLRRANRGCLCFVAQHYIRRWYTACGVKPVGTAVLHDMHEPCYLDRHRILGHLVAGVRLISHGQRPVLSDVAAELISQFSEDGDGRMFGGQVEELSQAGEYRPLLSLFAVALSSIVFRRLSGSLLLAHCRKAGAG